MLVPKTGKHCVTLLETELQIIQSVCSGIIRIQLQYLCAAARVVTVNKATPASTVSLHLSKKQFFLVTAMHVLAIAALLNPSTTGAKWCFIFHAITGLFGISIGYHRLLSHNSFRTNRLLQNIFATIGVLAFQGGPLSWVALHRSHHAHTDEPGDPHSARNGFLWSHIAWVVHKGPNGFRFKNVKKLSGSLYNDKYLNFLENNALMLNLLAFAIGIFTLGIKAALWAFPLRIVLLWHCTWLINSLCHSGRSFNKNTPSKYSAVNRPLLALITYGEGLHLNHHKLPRSPLFGPNGKASIFDVASIPILAMRYLNLINLRDSNEVHE